MHFLIEGIPKKHRKVFKENILSISDRFKILFKGDNANILYSKPYNIKENDLIQMSRHKKAMYQCINDFRLYQFNN